MAIFEEADIEYLICIKNNHKDYYIYNDEYFGYITSRSDYNHFYIDNPLRYQISGMTNKVNYFLSYKTFYPEKNMQIIYRIICYILNTKLEFYIEEYAKERYFYNVILYHFYMLGLGSGHAYDEFLFHILSKERYDYSKDLLIELVTIFYPEIEDRRHFRSCETINSYTDNILLIFYLLVKEVTTLHKYEELIVPQYTFDENITPDNFITDDALRDMEGDLLDQHFREEEERKREKIKKQIYDSKTSEILNEKDKKTIEKPISNENIIPVTEPKEDEKDYDYDSMPNAFEGFIEGGDAARYKSVIKDNCLPTGSPKLRMKNDNKANIARFLFCFDIHFSKSNSIFGITITEKDHSKKSYRNDFYRKLKEVYPPYEAKVKKFLA